MPERKTPQVRFKGFTDTWEQRKLGALMDVGSVKRVHQSDWRDSGVRFLRARDVVADFNNEEPDDYLYIDQKMYEEYSAQSGKVQQGDLLVTGVGTIGIPMLIKSEKPLYFKDGNIIWFKNKNAIDGQFFYYSFISKGIQDFIKESAGTGTVGTYTIDSGKKTPINLPTSIEEQKEIGIYFKNIDHLITLHQREGERLQMIKKSMLENCFPKNGEKVPRFRFAGFTGDWEQRKLGEVFEEYSEKGHPELPALTIIQGGGTIRRDESDRNLQYDKASLANYKMVNDGDFIVHLRSFEGGLEKATTLGVISPAYHTFHGEGTDSRFYYSYFRSPKFIDHDLKPHVYGIRDGRSIDIEGMRTIDIPWTSFAEQKAIGDYINALDHLITLHQSKLKMLKKIKESMLGKMLV